MTLVIAGLGNPGPQYSLNRHNVGFIAADMLAHTYSFPQFKMKAASFLSEGFIKTHKVILCKPSTYVNCSGQAISNLLNFYRIPPENLCVIHDDLDLPFSEIRFKFSGGNGGHNGLKNIDQHLGNSYWRFRVGIGHPGSKEAVSSYVLSNFNKFEEKSLLDLLEKISCFLPKMLSSPQEKWKELFSMA